MSGNYDNAIPDRHRPFLGDDIKQLLENDRTPATTKRRLDDIETKKIKRKVRCNCPGCQMSYELDIDNVGHKLRCGNCDVAFIVENAAGSTSTISEAMPASDTAHESARGPEHASPAAEEFISCKCPVCSSDYQTERDHVGITMRCNVCANSFMILDLTGMTVEVKEKKGLPKHKTSESVRKPLVSVPAAAVPGSAVPAPTVSASEPLVGAAEEGGGNWGLALVCLILLILIGLYLFLPFSPFNTNSPAALKNAESMGVHKSKSGSSVN